MSYYLLPKNNNNINITPNTESTDIKSYKYHSLYNFYNEIKKKFDFFVQTDNSSIKFKCLLKIMNPY